ncbi:MAG: mitochondrial fission ELM1 family protein [Candidatus Omnitrophica bacterium]|nr:mitochondrial fission ELM1 family protein [Candidatus Omnitrophota bacterium]MCF7877189.1 mitochondrial fission ELM1 family protein [Candidatus Omnitrophota bacterium]MCF7877992.1 mitochondrial fission ELM1 family protein [Candidatus Omnitrophota bacterium]MCF7892916.1 mitochondrial fission ELM1 family protein [Candidatus Omnitrophota bacterium]
MYFAAKLIQEIFYRLPLGVLKIFAKVLSLLFFSNIRKRKTAYRNLKMAFPDKTYPEIISILKGSYYNFSLSLVETLIADRIYPYIQLKGEHYFNGPGVCIGIHAGSWELANFIFAQKYKFAVLAKHQKNKKLDKFLNQIREKTGLKVCFNIRSLINYIKKDYYIGLVVDHGAEGEAETTNFFGQFIPTPKGAVFIAKKFQKYIYPCFSRRTGGFCHKVEFLDRIDPDSRDEKGLLELFNQLYQKQLVKYPREYLWQHKRFKYKKNRDVTIISDGRLGHLKQSKALLSILEKEGNYQIRSKVVEIKYKNNLMRIAANFIANFCPRFAPALIKALRLIVDKDSYRNLATTFSDIVISTGNFTAPVAKIFSSSLGAKIAVVLRTNLSSSRFDLAIIPEHDRIFSDNLVKIKGALTYPLGARNKADKCKSFFSLGPDKKIAFFVGGPVFDSRDFARNLKFFIKQLKAFSKDKGYKILISTSGRTPAKLEKYIKKELADFENTEVLVVAGEKNYDFVFEGFILLSDIVFSSSESISMVSEIASLGKPCVCVFFETEDEKRKVFLSSVKDEINFLRYPYKIKDKNLKTSQMFHRNRKILEKAVKRLL